MKEQKMESMPVSSRSRKQTELREKELREKNKRARLAARNEYWKRNAAKTSRPNLDGDDYEKEEDVGVADESVYLKRTSRMREKESSQNVDASLEESSDDSVQVVGERWNPLGAGFDNNEDGDDVDGVPLDFQPGPDNQSMSTDVDSEDSGDGAIDSHCSSPSLSTENDDNVSDEDFLVDDTEMRTVYSSESSQYYSGYASEKVGKWKGKTSAPKKITERFMEEDIQSSDEIDEDYLQFLKYYCGSSFNQGENAANGGKRKRGRPPKNRNSGFEYEADDGAISGNHYCSKNGSFVQSSPLPPHLNSKSGATRKRGRPRKNPCVIIRSDSESENDLIGGRLPKGIMNVGVDSETEDELKPMSAYRKRGRPPKKTIVETESVSENSLVGEFRNFRNDGTGNREKGKQPQFEDSEDGDELYLQWIRNLQLSRRCENGGSSKRGRPPKAMKVEVGSEPKNGVHGKRGRPPKNWNNGCDSKRGYKRGRGRPWKNWNKEFDSE